MDSGIRALSSLLIDVDKDWAGKKIENLGAPASANDVLRRRGSLADMPDMALDKIMVGQGSGSSPIEEDKTAGGLTFTELAGGDSHTTVGTTTWEDWDLSAIVPSGTNHVLLCVKVGTSPQSVGVRKNGTALERKDITSAPGVAEICCFILSSVDANRIIEVYADVAGSTNYRVWGYWS